LRILKKLFIVTGSEAVFSDIPLKTKYHGSTDILRISPKRRPDHMKKLPARGFGVTMNPQEKKTQRR